MAKLGKVLLTGGGGFIARNLAEHLQTKYEIFTPLHRELDVLDEEAVGQKIDEEHIDYVVHCANVGGGRDTLDVPNVAEKNVRMFLNIARNAHRLKRIINLGSGAEYDVRSYKPQMKEEYFDKHVPIDAYGFSKYVCSKFILMSPQDMVCLRLFGVFGKYEKYYLKFISNAIVKNLLGLPITIKQNVRFDYLSVDDLATVVEYFLGHRGRYRDYNVVSGEVVDLVSIAALVNSLGDKPFEVRILETGMGKEYSGDNSRLRAEMKEFKPSPFKDKVSELYEWYKRNLNSIDKDLLRKGDAYIPLTRTSLT